MIELLAWIYLGIAFLVFLRFFLGRNFDGQVLSSSLVAGLGWPIWFLVVLGLGLILNHRRK
jgi:hypothetical protein